MNSLDSLEPFFSFLGERLTDENDASDLLYAAFKACAAFRSVVLDHLGVPSTAPIEITREKTIESSRPDFYLVIGEAACMLVEVKLFDRNYHYDEYSKLTINGLKPQIALLSAHRPDRDLPGWRVIEWRELIEEAERTGDAFASALAQYFRRVTMSEKLERISFGRPRGILSLNRALKRVILDYQSDNFRTQLYRNAKDSFSEVSSGYCYKLEHRGEPSRWAYPYFCLQYDDSTEGIVLALRKDFEPKYDVLLVALREFYKERLKTEGWWSHVIMPVKDFERLMSSDNLEEQLGILRKFFNEVNSIIEGCL